MEGNVSVWDGIPRDHQEAPFGECGHDSSQIDPKSDRDIKCKICWENREILIKRLIEPFEHAFALKDDSPPLSNVRGTRSPTSPSPIITSISSGGITKNIAAPVAGPKRLRLRSASRRKPVNSEHKDSMIRSASSDADIGSVTPISSPKGASTSPQLASSKTVAPPPLPPPPHQTASPVREHNLLSNASLHQSHLSDDEAEECIRVKDISMDPPGRGQPLTFTGKGGPGSGFSASGATWQFSTPAAKQKERKTSLDEEYISPRKSVSKSKISPKRPKSMSLGGGGSGGSGQQTLLSFFLPKLSQPGDKEAPANTNPKFAMATATGLKKEVQVQKSTKEMEKPVQKELPPPRIKSTRGREVKAVNYNEDSDSEELLD